jgi:hypothetical protein
MLTDGNIYGVPNLTGADLQRAYEIYGIPVGYIHGKTVERPTAHIPVDPQITMREKHQELHTDVMHIDGAKFLISVAEPLQLTLQSHLENETADQLGLGLQGHFSVLRSRGFIQVVVHMDPQTGFRALTTSFPGVTIDIGGAGDYVPKVDQKIRRIKELYRSVKNDLPWNQPKAIRKDLVAYAVARLNICRTTALTQNCSPAYLFTGAKVNYKKQLILAFCDYCEVYDKTDNTSHSRTLPSFALSPCNNSSGSWEFLNLCSNMRIRRSNWKKMVTMQTIIDIINNMSMEDAREEVVQPINQMPEAPVQEEPTDVEPENPQPDE